MITIKCTTDNCPQTNMEQFVLGEPIWVECGGCKEKLQAIAVEPDPPQLEPKDYLPQ